MNRILVIDYCLDLMGGVEHTLCTLSNKLSKQAIVETLSENKLKHKSFYEYNYNIKQYYLFDYSNNKHVKEHGVLSLPQKIIRRTLLPIKIYQFFHKHDNIDTIIFGKASIALRFIPIISKTNPNAKIIVRDATHLYDFKLLDKINLKRRFPNNVSTYIVSSSESLKAYKKFFKSKNIKLEKVYNPLGIVPIKKYSPQNKVIVSIGRMDDNQKGFDNLIYAFVKTHSKHPDWELHLYGNSTGSEKIKLTNLIAQLNATKYIHIFPATQNVVKTLNKASIFVLASRFEGYANILIEALACGIPSISYDWLMGANEIIKDGENGIIVPLQNRRRYLKGSCNTIDINNLSKAINSLIEKPELMKKFHNSGPSIIASRNIDTIIRKWQEIIMEKKNVI